MYTISVSPNILEQRLDSEFYNPKGLEAFSKLNDLKGTKQLFEIVDGSRKITNGVRGPAWEESSYKLIRLQDCEDWIVNHAEASSISLEQYEENKRCKLQPNDIVVAIGGYVGNASIVNTNCNAVIGQHSAVLPNVESKGLDSRYVLAFLNTSIAEAIFERYVSGTVQAGINLEDLRILPIYVPNVLAQKYIGEKVRQAERLRSWAKQLKADVNSVLDDLALPIHAKPDMFSYAKKSILGDRLDPRPYRSNVVDLVDSIESLDHDKISTLVTFSSGCPVSSNDFVEENFAIPLVRIRNIAEEGFKGLDTGTTQHTYNEAANYHAKEGMIVLGMDGYFKAQFFIPEELPMLINQRVAMLTVNGIRVELLTHWLNRSEGQLQLNQWAVKTTVEHTSLTDLAKVLIPRLNDNLETELADKLLDARFSIRLSYKLTNLAKHLVENLIEGIVSEAELVSAQQALDAGDDSQDRALLERISAKGIDGEGTPLFDDIDQLYDLLDQAKQALDADNSMAEV